MYRMQECSHEANTRPKLSILCSYESTMTSEKNGIKNAAVNPIQSTKKHENNRSSILGRKFRSSLRGFHVEHKNFTLMGSSHYQKTAVLHRDASEIIYRRAPKAEQRNMESKRRCNRYRFAFKLQTNIYYCVVATNLQQFLDQL